MTAPWTFSTIRFSELLRSGFNVSESFSSFIVKIVHLSGPFAWTLKELLLTLHKHFNCITKVYNVINYILLKLQWYFQLTIWCMNISDRLTFLTAFMNLPWTFQERFWLKTFLEMLRKCHKTFYAQSTFVKTIRNVGRTGKNEPEKVHDTVTFTFHILKREPDFAIPSIWLIVPKFIEFNDGQESWTFGNV